MKIGRLPILLLLLMLSFVATQELSARAAEGALEPVPGEDMIWTLWDSDIYALVDDGDLLWVGSGSGLVRFEKESGVHLRISTADGLPHRRVVAGALDGSGNRWFGGDGGLSKLDAAGEWTHYNSKNSGLPADVVDGIAVTANGDVWTSHADSVRIGRLHPDGSWVRYPNRETALSLAYETIKTTINTNDLWTAAGGELWVGYDVFDGAQWHERQPEGGYDAPTVVRADSEHHVWALDGDAVFEWDGQQWLHYWYQPTIDGALQSLEVDKNDVVWVGGEENYDYYFYSYYGAVASLPQEPGSFYLDHSFSTSTAATILLPAAEGLWAAGINWLHQPGGPMHQFEDVPYFGNARQVLIDGYENTWIYSPGHPETALQILDDRGTATMTDDVGELVSRPPTVTALGIAGNGDLWSASSHFFRFFTAYEPTRFHNGVAIDYATPIEGVRIDYVFAEDARTTWFAYVVPDLWGREVESGIWALDDGGTPLIFGDDVWSSYDNGGSIVAARDGKLWKGGSSGVYRYHEDGWEQISSEPAFDLIPAEDGVLFVDTGGSDVLVIDAAGQKSWRFLAELIENDLALVRSTTHRNRLWRVTPDGAVWYWHHVSGFSDKNLARYDGHILQTYPGPLEEGAIEVDKNNHVWLTSSGDLWRMSPPANFRLSGGPSTWFITPNESRDFAIMAVPIEGYKDPVTLSVSGLPAGVLAELNAAEVMPGETALVTLKTGNIPLSRHTIKISGISGDISRSQDVTLAVVEQVHEQWMPALFDD